MGEARRLRTIVVVGTGTEVGKTWTTCALIDGLRADGVNVAARKLVQSFDPDDLESSHDANRLAAATGEDPLVVCPQDTSYGIPKAPPIAAALLGLDVPHLEDLLDFWPARPADELLFVECAGGLMSPQASDGDCLDVIEKVRPELVILVAPDRLGAISDVRLCLAALERSGVEVAVVLNRFGASIDDTNAHWLRNVDSVQLFVVPDELAALIGRCRALPSD